MGSIPFTLYDFFGYLAAGFITLVATDTALGSKYLDRDPMPLSYTLLLIVTAYTLGHVVAHMASLLLESFLLRKVLGPPEDHMFREAPKSGRAWLMPGHFAPLPFVMQQRVLARASKEGISSPGRGLFLHCHAQVKRDEATQERLNTFLYLYGFSRNMSMALFLCAVIFLVAAYAPPSLLMNALRPGSSITGVVICLALSFVMFFRYIKFYRIYTQEVFVSYAELTERGTEKS